MKHIFILAPLVIAACVPLEQTCGPVADIVVSYTKEGSPIYMHPPLLPDCVSSGPTTHEYGQPPVNEPPVTPEPPTAKVKGNNGHGNGDQDAPGNSEFNNRAENRGGNHNGRNDAPANSWHGE